MYRLFGRREEAEANCHEAPLHGSEHRTYYPALDGIRALAALMVFFVHANILPANRFGLRRLPMGWAGVDLFFVLSGFLITGILWRTREDENYFRNFYIRRALRIFPLYYSVLIILAAVGLLLGIHWRLMDWSWFVYLGNWVRYLPELWHSSWTNRWDALWHDPWNIRWDGITAIIKGHRITLVTGHFWSLCVEEQFYLVWPVTLYLLRTRRRIIITCMAVIICVALARIGAYYLLPVKLIRADFLYHITIFRMDSLLIGAMLAILLAGPSAPLARRAGWVLFGTSVGALIVAFVVAKKIDPTTSTAISAPWISTIGYSFVVRSSASRITPAAAKSTIVHSIFEAAPLKWLGRRSYGFYVYHWIVLNLLLDFDPAGLPGKVLIPIAFLATTFLAWASFQFLEQPFLRLKDRF